MIPFTILYLATTFVYADWHLLGNDPYLSPQRQPKGLKYGDIRLNPQQLDGLKKGKNMGGAKSFGYAPVNDLNLRWKNAVIPYEFDCSIERLEKAVDAVMKAMQEWENNTCIRFVKRTNEKYFLKFIRNTGCWGEIGQVKDSKISVGDNCEWQFVMTHEIGHVVGFYHEQSRLDRDDYVQVLWENVPEDLKSNFDIQNNTDSLGVPYDYESIMHYPWNAFSKNRNDTLKPIKDTKGKVPYVKLSKLDALQTSLMYNCPAIEKQRMKARALRHDGELRNKRSIDKNDCVDENKYCAEWAAMGYCSTNPYTQQKCRLSCKSPSCKSKKLQCVDKSTSCSAWAKASYCTSNVVVAKDCVKSCNPICKVPVKPTTSPGIHPTQPTKCTDRYKDCPTWKQFGHCQINPTVKKYCQKTCNPTCNDVPRSTLPPTFSTTQTQAPTVHPTKTPGGKPKRIFLGNGKLCKDNNPKCSYWASVGECTKNPGYMLETCMLSCNTTKCDKPGLKPDGDCANPLGLSWDGSMNFKIPDSAFYSPSHYYPGEGWQASAQNARLYFEDDYDSLRVGAWCAISEDSAKSNNGYVQVDLGSSKTVSHIATQGRYKYFERVAKFKIEYSPDGNRFKTYQDMGIDKVFNGNCDHVTPVLNKFSTPFQARYIRYRPVEWNYPCVRMEFYGC